MTTVQSLTVPDSSSRAVSGFVWRLRAFARAAEDVKDTLDDALRFTGLDTVKVKHNPRLLSDNGPSCIASDLAKYLAEQNMEHTRGRPYHPQTQGKIERYHGSLSNLTPVGVCHRRGEAILARRKRINLSTMSMRRKMHARNRVKSLALTS